MYEDYLTIGSRYKKIYSTFNMAARREFSVRDCVKSYMIDIQRRFERGNHDADGLDFTVFRIFTVFFILVRYSGGEGIHPRVIDLLRQVKDAVTESLHTDSHVAETMFRGVPGRPKFNIPKEQLDFLIKQHLSTPAVADILGVSCQTVFRRLRKFGLSCRAVYSLMSDEQLDTIIMLSILAEFLETGYKRMNGFFFKQEGLFFKRAEYVKP